MERLKSDDETARRQVVQALNPSQSQTTPMMNPVRDIISTETDGSTETVTVTKVLIPGHNTCTDTRDSLIEFKSRKHSRNHSKKELVEPTLDKENIRNGNTESKKVSQISKAKSHARVVTKTSSTEKGVKAQALPSKLQDQILHQPLILESAESSSRALKWMKPKEESPAKEDLRSVIERRIGLIRQFTDPEQDNRTCHDFTEGTSFF